MGINLTQNPNISKKYEATNIFKEIKTKPNIKKMIDQIIISYVDFFNDLKSYKFINFKNKAELIAIS